MADPLVSIITPSFNQGEFIADNIDSISNQSYSNIEHLIYDNESDDCTHSVFNQYSHIENLRVQIEPDRGQSHAINKGFADSKGDIIGWLNSDDVYLYENTIEDVVSCFIESDVDVLYGDIAIIDEKNRIVAIESSVPFDESRLKRWNFIHQPALFMSSDVINKLKLDESLSYSMDYDFWIRMCESNMDLSFQYIPNCLAGFRVHKDQKTFSANSERPNSAVTDPYSINTLDFVLDRALRFSVLIQAAARGVNLQKGKFDLAFNGEYSSKSNIVKNSVIKNNEYL